MATIRVKNPNLGGEKWITIPTKILSEADHIVTNKGQGDLYLSNDGTYKDVIKSANDYTDKLIELITGSSPDILETLKELSNQTSDNKDFINVLNKSIATKLDKTANAVSASKLATPIKLWGNDFDGSLSVYGNLCAPNGNLGLGINTNNVVLGNNTNPSYIYGSSVMFKTGTDAVTAYISYDGKVGIGTANPLKTLDINGSTSISGILTVSGGGHNRGTIHLISSGDTPNDLYFGSNNTLHWSLTSRESSDPYFGLFNKSLEAFTFRVDNDTNILNFSKTPLVGGYYEIWHEGNLNPFNLSGNTLKLGKSTNLNQSYAELVSVASESSDDGVALRYWKTQDYLGSYSGIQIDSRGIWYDKTGDTLYKIWNEDNDGPGSGLDADTLDGLLAWLFLRIIDPIDDVNNTNLYKLYSFITDLNSRCLNVPLGFSSGEMIYIAGYDTGFMLVSSYTKDELIYRRGTNSLSTNTIINNDWKTIAFTDSTVANATKAYALLSNAASGNVDANKIVTANCYMLYTSYMGNESTNVPVANAYLNGLLSFGLHPNGTTAQLYISKDNPLYYRSSVTNDWKELTTSDGYYKDMRVGLADDLGDMEEKVEEEYIIQPTANTNEIRDGYAHIDSLKGNSVVWNLLVSSNKIFVNSSNATTIVNKTDNSFTATSIAGNDEKSVVIGPVFKDYNIYLITFEYISNLSYKLQHTCGFDNIEPASTFTRHVHIQKRSDLIYSRLYFYNYTTTTEEWNLEVKDLIIVDLTKMFGAGNEPTTLEEFEARRPKNVSNAYNEGEIINLTADSIKSIGFNQWDEEYEIGGISSTGVLANYNDRIRPKNYIPCVPNASYFAKGYFRHGIFFYNENKKWIENKQVYGDDFQFFTPSNAVYMLWNSSSGYFTEGSYCINLYNEASNGTYEPYKEFVRQLPTNLFEGGMKSTGTTYDEIYWDKNKKKYIKVTRIGSIDLGSLEWERTVKALVSSEYKFISTINISNINGVPESLHTCSNYLHGDVNEEGTDKVLDIGNKINIVDNRYTDANTFKQAMQGVILHYELAEPIIEELDIPYMDYEVSNDGTERIESSTPSTPIKASVTYNFDAVNTIKLNRFDVSTIKENMPNGVAKSASKLAKPVKLWGLEFDGSSDIGGLLKIWNNLPLSWNNSSGIQTECLKLDTNNNLIIGGGVSGNVGISNDDPQYKLDVDGNASFKNYLYLGGKRAITDDNGKNYLIFGTHTNNTYIRGLNAYFQIGENYENTVSIVSNGNMGIGTANPLYKLDVNGTVKTNGSLFVSGAAFFTAGSVGIYIKDNSIMTHDAKNTYVSTACSFTQQGDTSFLHNIFVKNQITSGDLVDWYGVSWSENDSNPTCTRIGNMALHRSLPILSAMKGYMIQRTSATVSETPFPLTDDWWTLKYNTSNNEQYNVTAYENGNTMVKIPEFWYIDDYEPTTKTHNLKISQTAKAGWLHHKEAYVGAYEGLLSGKYYASKKGVIPTVSQTREQLRTAARANGYEDEYKWNIYTYEEHRAICHLFLVEYATRNSQLAVNTELTSDGFKQGGLGSGCTTGTVTINGKTTYSFIPTGTTDSLGNGSGQVAYTVTLTDADGNEIGTVTRYANRYRGIENPFGHIWKHIDDIVNVYNAETTHKIIYKCNKPEHFATNKNAKYKPLCSLPGGSKMQGWAKEIKATINCDFFKYSVGGSESTYWCDYNYDSDDTSEHCLLIGGNSDNGGRTGLFHFHLNAGVGHSGVSVGSRLTYLP